MAEASQEKTTPDRKTQRELVKRIFRLIEDNSLDEIKEIFGTLKPEQRIKVLNSTMYGCIPLYVAVNYTNVEISRYLIKLSVLQGPEKMSERWKKCGHPLIPAMHHGNRELIELILQYLPDINAGISGILSPLMIAIFLRNLTSVKLIVSKGADINRPCLDGRTPLMYSTSNIQVCNFLISQGADVNHQDDEGITVLHLALVWNHIVAINQLIKAGADVTIRNDEGISPLTWATVILNENMFGDDDLVRLGALQVLNYFI